MKWYQRWICFGFAELLDALCVVVTFGNWTPKLSLKLAGWWVLRGYRR
jgi:hypothetical protein